MSEKNQNTEKKLQCQECGLWPAEVTVTTVVNGKSTVKKVCRQCLKKYQNGDISTILAAIFSSMAKKKNADQGKSCPECGQTLSDFQKSGKLGCASCYTAFREELKPILTKVQGRTSHAGRRPLEKAEDASFYKEIEGLKEKMEEAVLLENFEEAARLRDLIRDRKAEKQTISAAPEGEDHHE